MCQVEEDGIEKPVLLPNEPCHRQSTTICRYTWEALALLFSVKKLHQYIFGHKLQLLTDHKPLLGLLHRAKPLPVLSPRMLHWSLLLSAYNYELQYVPGYKMTSANVFSRLPLPVAEEHESPLGDTLLIEATPEVPQDLVNIAALTRTDLILSRVQSWILQS